MRQLILVRHAKTEPLIAGLSDFDRALTQQGREDAPRVGKAIAKAGGAPKVALVSEANRAQQTWDLIRPQFEDCETRIIPALYLADPETILDEIDHADAEQILIVAHNPGLHELAANLATAQTALDDEIQRKYPPCASSIFERTDPTSPLVLRAFIRAKTLRP